MNTVINLSHRVEKDTDEWKTFLRNLSWSKQKSNRDVLCLKCWKIMKYEECVKHKVNSPDHLKSILTSKEFASETKFVAVARAMNKITFENGKEYYDNPFKSKDRRGRPSTQLILYREELKKQEEQERKMKEEQEKQQQQLSATTHESGECCNRPFVMKSLVENPDDGLHQERKQCPNYVELKDHINKLESKLEQLALQVEKLTMICQQEPQVNKNINNPDLVTLMKSQENQVEKKIQLVCEEEKDEDMKEDKLGKIQTCENVLQVQQVSKILSQKQDFDIPALSTPIPQIPAKITAQDLFPLSQNEVPIQPLPIQTQVQKFPNWQDQPQQIPQVQSNQIGNTSVPENNYNSNALQNVSNIQEYVPYITNIDECKETLTVNHPRSTERNASFQNGTGSIPQPIQLIDQKDADFPLYPASIQSNGVLPQYQTAFLESNRSLSHDRTQRNAVQGLYQRPHSIERFINTSYNSAFTPKFGLNPTGIIPGAVSQNLNTALTLIEQTTRQNRFAVPSLPHQQNHGSRSISLESFPPNPQLQNISLQNCAYMQTPVQPLSQPDQLPVLNNMSLPQQQLFNNLASQPTLYSTATSSNFKSPLHQLMNAQLPAQMNLTQPTFNNQGATYNIAQSESLAQLQNIDQKTVNIHEQIAQLQNALIQQLAQKDAHQNSLQQQ